MGHPDFRVAGKIFATLGYPQSGWGVVCLTPEQQELFVRMEPKSFVPVKGGWGRAGNTNVRLAAARRAAVREALIRAWRNRAPKDLVRKVEGAGLVGGVGYFLTGGSAPAVAFALALASLVLFRPGRLEGDGAA